jgi:N-acetylmuramic acid 6-phosphate etherase
VTHGASGGRLSRDPLPPTEEPNPASAGIDAKGALDIARLIHQEDRRAWEAVGEALEPLARLIDAVVAAFRAGGRLIYLGAGTSGRLGVLDASECPPTFGVGAELVVGLIAGGDAALRAAIEGAEDSEPAGREAVAAAGVNGRDVVCGITASGSTPFVWGGIEEAGRRAATTALITTHPRLEARRPVDALDHLIVLPVGPEVIAGSTRMKSGTATKMALNIVTTAAMVRWGKVHDNLMVDLRPANRKLRRRAVRLVMQLAGAGEEEAAELLERTRQNVKAAVICSRGRLEPEEAEALLARHRGHLRAALGELRCAPPAPESG